MRRILRFVFWTVFSISILENLNYWSQDQVERYEPWLVDDLKNGGLWESPFHYNLKKVAIFVYESLGNQSYVRSQKINEILKNEGYRGLLCPIGEHERGKDEYTFTKTGEVFCIVHGGKENILNEKHPV